MATGARALARTTRSPAARRVTARLAGHEPFRAHVFGLFAERGPASRSREQVEIVSAPRRRVLASAAGGPIPGRALAPLLDLRHGFSPVGRASWS
jgi:hypothetical protein